MCLLLQEPALIVCLLNQQVDDQVLNSLPLTLATSGAGLCIPVESRHQGRGRQQPQSQDHQCRPECCSKPLIAGVLVYPDGQCVENQRARSPGE